VLERAKSSILPNGIFFSGVILRFQNANSRWLCRGLVRPEIVYNGKIPNTDTDIAIF